MKKNRALCMILILIFCLCGCSLPEKEADADTTSVIVGKKGGITQVIVESFDQSYYNLDELRGEIEKKASQYNAQSGNDESVTLEKLELSEDKQLKAVIAFGDSKAYTGFNEKAFFAGTVSEAYDAGYVFPDLKSPEGQALPAQGVLEKGDMRIVIMEENQQLHLPGKVAYMSEGVSLVDEKTAFNLNEGQMAYIIYN